MYLLIQLSQQPHKVGIIIILIVHMGKQKLRSYIYKWQSQEIKPGRLAPELILILPTVLYFFQYKVYIENYYNYSNGEYIISVEITYLFSDSGISETLGTRRRNKHLYDKVT